MSTNPETEAKLEDAATAVGPAAKAKKARKTAKYYPFQPMTEIKDGMVALTGCPKSTRLADIDKFIKANDEKILDDFGTDEVKVYIFPEPIIRTIKRETKVSVT